MSLLPSLTFTAPGAPLFAPVSGGGGGGGGPNLTVSTLTLNTSTDTTPSILTPGAGSQMNINANGGVIFGDIPAVATGASVNIYGGTGQIWCEDNSANVVFQIIPSGNNGKCSITQGTGGTGIALSNISSINGAAPGGSVPANLSVSSLSAAETVSTLALNLENINSLGQYPGRLRANSVDILVEDAGGNEYGLKCGNLSVSSINGGTPPTGNLSASNLTLTGGANSIEMLSDNTATATIWATGASGLTLSTVQFLNGGTPLVSATTPAAKPIVQSGYADSVPYTSTILFPVPYDNDKISVMITPSSKGITGGANPNMSLVTGWGTDGVSSIGFQVDSRNGGVGYNGSFYWMSLPWC